MYNIYSKIARYCIIIIQLNFYSKDLLFLVSLFWPGGKVPEGALL